MLLQALLLGLVFQTFFLILLVEVAETGDGNRPYAHNRALFVIHQSKYNNCDSHP
jgi:hypothetical protein